MASIVGTIGDDGALLRAASVDGDCSVSYWEASRDDDDEDENVALRNHATVAPKTIMRTSRLIKLLPEDARPETVELMRTMVMLVRKFAVCCVLCFCEHF